MNPIWVMASTGLYRVHGSHLILRIPAGSRRASSLNCSIPFSLPYTHFKHMVLLVINMAEKVNSNALCHRLSRSKMG